jgi:GAF domain-containing protein
MVEYTAEGMMKFAAARVDRTQRPVTFLELNVLAHIADLAAAAIERQSRRESARRT